MWIDSTKCSASSSLGRIQTIAWAFETSKELSIVTILHRKFCKSKKVAPKLKVNDYRISNLE